MGEPSNLIDPNDLRFHRYCLRSGSISPDFSESPYFVKYHSYTWQAVITDEQNVQWVEFPLYSSVEVPRFEILVALGQTPHQIAQLIQNDYYRILYNQQLRTKTQCFPSDISSNTRAYYIR